MNKYKKITLDGIIFNNPTFMLVLGTCPTLAMIKSSAMSAVGMGLCVIVVLTLSNIIISALRKIIPNEVRIPCYIVIIATLVTLVQMVLEKFVPDLYDSLGTFLALIVVNCIVLGRAEAFANKHTVLESAVDGLANGIGFTLSLGVMGIICELLGSAALFGFKMPWTFKIRLFSSPAGAFIVYGLCIALFTFVMDKFMISKRVKENKIEREKLMDKINAPEEAGAKEANV
ncbi:MAG: electron transport complex subunit RsxE [Candidatus Coproplasma sp.]